MTLAPTDEDLAQDDQPNISKEPIMSVMQFKINPSTYG